MSDETTTKPAEQVIDFTAPGPANLAQVPPQASPFAENMWTPERVALIKNEICPAGISDGDFALFLEKCRRSGLDPLLNECYCVPRWLKVKVPQGDGKFYEKKVERHVFQASEQGMEVRAHRAGDFEGMRFGAIYANDECAIDFGGGTVKHFAAPGKPRGALIGAWAIAKRRGRDYHPVAHVLFSEYVQTYEGKAVSQWKDKPETMIAKCARALALRLAYPYEFAGVFTSEEMGAGMDSQPTGDGPASERTVDATPSAPSDSKTDDLDAFMKKKAAEAAAKPTAAATPAPAATTKPAAAPTQAKTSTPAADTARQADVIDFPKKTPPAAASSPAAAPAPAAASPAAADDSIKVGGVTVKISEATVAQLEEAKAFAVDQLKKNPTATWVPRVEAKLKAVDTELASRAAALEAALGAETPPEQPTEEPPEPGSDG